MSRFLDILMVVILLLFVWRGARKGFVYTLCSLAAVGVAVVGGHFFANALTPTVAGFFQPALEKVLRGTLERQVGELSRHWDALTGGQILAALEEQGGILMWAVEHLKQSSFSEMLSTPEILSASGILSAVVSLSKELAAVVAERVAHGVLFFIGFLLVMVVWGILTHTLDLFTHLPVIHSCNELLGGLLGLITGLIFVYLAAWILRILTIVGLIPSEMMAGTTLLRFLAEHSPLDLLLS